VQLTNQALQKVRRGGTERFFFAESAGQQAGSKTIFLTIITPSINFLEDLTEKAMSKFVTPFILACALLSSAALAQTPPSNPLPSLGPSPPPPVPPPPPAGQVPAGVVLPGDNPVLLRSDTGLDRVGSDGVSTKSVPAVPCSPYARETDGITTCIGIPGPTENSANLTGKRKRRNRS
jgi:hypothetical protein